LEFVNRKNEKIKRRSNRLENNKQADVMATLKSYELRREVKMRRMRRAVKSPSAQAV
jgi:hypothetical protein